MLHSGAFYDVEKKLLEPGELPEHAALVQVAELHDVGDRHLAAGRRLLLERRRVPRRSVGARRRPDDRDHAVGRARCSCGWLVYDGAVAHARRDATRALATVLSIALLFGAICGVRAGVQRARRVHPDRRADRHDHDRQRVVRDRAVAARARRRDDGRARSRTRRCRSRAKQRSIHNNYLTFPLLFIMVSNHFPAATTHHLNWLILIAVMIGGAGVRHFMNMRYRGGGKQLRDGGVARAGDRRWARRARRADGDHAHRRRRRSAASITRCRSRARRRSSASAACRATARTRRTRMFHVAAERRHVRHAGGDPRDGAADQGARGRSARRCRSSTGPRSRTSSAPSSARGSIDGRRLR